MSLEITQAIHCNNLELSQFEKKDQIIIQKAIDAINGSHSKIEIATLRNGKTGRALYRLSFDSNQYVIHIADEDLASFAILTKLAADHAFGPKLIYQNTERSALITEFVIGKQLSPKDLENKEIINQLVDGIKTLHQSPLQLQFNNKLGALVSNLKKIGDPYQVIDYVDPILQAIARQNFPKVPCHNDIHPGNILYSLTGKVQLIDWDDAGMSDPFYDLARISIEFCFNEEQNAALLRQYFIEPTKLESARFFLMRQLFLVSIASDMLTQSQPLDQTIKERLALSMKNKVLINFGTPTLLKDIAPTFFNTFLHNAQSQEYVNSMEILSTKHF